MPYLILAGCLLAALLIVRLSLGNTAQPLIKNGAWQTIGRRDVQADICHEVQRSHEQLLLIADGIGVGDKGRLAAQLAVDTVARQFELAGSGQNAAYFFQYAFQAANAAILRHIPDATAGTYLLAAMISDGQLQYGLAGSCLLYVLRNGKLYSISDGQTMNTLAKEAFRQKRISRAEALEVMRENRSYNFLGKDGFQAPELVDVPVKLRKGDLILLCTDGVTEALSPKEIVSLLKIKGSCQDKSRRLIETIERKKIPEQDNASVVLARFQG